MVSQGDNDFVISKHSRSCTSVWLFCLLYYAYVPMCMRSLSECALFRNERDNAISKIQHALTKEGDIFLGQKIIEVRRIGPPHDVWYKLGESLFASCKVGTHVE